jgi:hypothetical protein
LHLLSFLREKSTAAGPLAPPAAHLLKQPRLDGSRCVGRHARSGPAQGQATLLLARNDVEAIKVQEIDTRFVGH